MKQKKSALSHYKAFSEKTNVNLVFESIDLIFYDKFINYCYNTAGLHTGRTGSLIKSLKAFLNWATDRGYNTKMDFKKKSFKKPTCEPEIIYLTEKELFQLYNAEINTKKYANVRDFFCFGCYTGLRFSDIKNLAPSNLIEKEIEINNQRFEALWFLFLSNYVPNLLM